MVVSSPLADLSVQSCSISLRVRHPSIDPDIITTTLGITPEHFWACGEPRRSPSGAKLGGTRRETYWSATLPETYLLETHPESVIRLEGQAHATTATGSHAYRIEPSMLLARQVVQLKRHRAFFERLSAEGGEASLLIEIAPEAESVFRLDPAVMRQLAELGLAVDFEVIVQVNADS